MTDLFQSPPVQLLLFTIDGSHYALRLLMVERVLPMVEVSPLPNAPAITLGVINYHVLSPARIASAINSLLA